MIKIKRNNIYTIVTLALLLVFLYWLNANRLQNGMLVSVLQKGVLPGPGRFYAHRRLYLCDLHH